MKDWEHYEDQILERLQEKFPGAKLKKNQKIRGKFSKAKRQIDILFTGEVLGKEVIGVVECKKFSKKINVKLIDGFFGFLHDESVAIVLPHVMHRFLSKNIKLIRVNKFR